MAALRRPLYIAGAGAVTAAGLTAPQTCAAIRAAVSGYTEIIRAEPFGAPQIVARIPAHWRLRASEGDWLVNMAARAILEALGESGIPPDATAVFLTPPESFRAHPAYDDVPAQTFLSAVLAATGLVFHPASRAFDGGAAASLGLLDHALDTLETRGARQILLGGVDSLVNAVDFARLEQAHRLKGDQNAQGLVPGEAAAIVRLTTAPDPAARVQAAILATGVDKETNSVLSENHSQGTALLAALRAATSGGQTPEAAIGFVISDNNGERYRGWEELIAHPRFYRTRRERLPIAYPAMAVGDIGAASAALALLLAADAFALGYAPGDAAICEIASESGLRGAAVVRLVRRGS